MTFAAIFPSDPLSLLLTVAVAVLCVTTVAMIVSAGTAERHRRSRPHRLGAIPVVPMINPPRAGRPAAPVEAHRGPPIVRPVEPIEATHREALARDDPRASQAARVEAAHALADQLAASDPQRLAEIIGRWMQQDGTPP